LGGTGKIWTRWRICGAFERFQLPDLSGRNDDAFVGIRRQQFYKKIAKLREA
jgi:hypothetical protein